MREATRPTQAPPRIAARLARVAGLLAGMAGLAAGPAGARPLQVVATTSSLGSLARAVGGEEVDVTVLARGRQDAHFVEPRPSFIRKLHDADLFVQVGMELEIGWAPVLLRSARNAHIQPGARGHVDASAAIAALEVPTARVDRSMGDVHPYGNPHYLTDPVNGLRVAALLRDRLAALRPQSEGAFRTGYERFERRLLEALVGPELARRRAPAELLRLLDEDPSLGALEPAEARQALGGWLGALRGRAGTRAVQDHRLWPYFARRFGLELVATLEPRPGIAPTTRHLAAVVERMRAEQIGLVLSSPYFDPRHARFVAEQTGASVAEMAHQVGAHEDAGDYLSMIDYNVRQILGAPAP